MSVARYDMIEVCEITCNFHKMIKPKEQICIKAVEAKRKKKIIYSK